MEIIWSAWDTYDGGTFLRCLCIQSHISKLRRLSFKWNERAYTINRQYNWRTFLKCHAHNSHFDLVHWIPFSTNSHEFTRFFFFCETEQIETRHNFNVNLFYALSLFLMSFHQLSQFVRWNCVNSAYTFWKRKIVLIRVNGSLGIETEWKSV